jgi:hypothetical protein
MFLLLPQIGKYRKSHTCYSNSIYNFILLISLLICPQLISCQIINSYRLLNYSVKIMGDLVAREGTAASNISKSMCNSYDVDF